jgi:hypothetical protein
VDGYEKWMEGEREKGGGDFGRINEGPMAPSCSGGQQRQKEGCSPTFPPESECIQSVLMLVADHQSYSVQYLDSADSGL